jgi:hypothetical protein
MISISRILISAILFFDNVRFGDDGYIRIIFSQLRIFLRKKIFFSKILTKPNFYAECESHYIFFNINLF